MALLYNTNRYIECMWQFNRKEKERKKKKSMIISSGNSHIMPYVIVDGGVCQHPNQPI